MAPIAKPPRAAVPEGVAKLQSPPPTPPAAEPASPLAELTFTASERAKASGKKKLQPAPSSSWPRRHWPWLAAGGGVLAVVVALLTALLLRVQTKAGTVVLEIDEPDAEVLVDDQQITITPGKGKEPVTIQADEGDHQLKVSKGGFVTFPRRFTIKSGATESIRVHLEPVKVASRQEPVTPGPSETSPPADPKTTPVPTEPTTPARKPSLRERLAGTKWVNSNNTTFEWDSEGTLFHAGKAREYRVVDDRQIRIAFSDEHVDTLSFDEALTRFDQYSTLSANARPLFTGRRQEEVTAEPPKPIELPPITQTKPVTPPLTPAKPQPLSPTLAKLAPGSMAGRIGPAKLELLRDGGGTKESEEAVARGLKWLVGRQHPKNGNWSCRDPKLNEAATALALLPFLGAGESSTTGPYARTVSKGLLFLRSRQDRKEGFIGQGYTHALATIALCEAYGLTGDPHLKKSAQEAINYIVRVQHAGGGWRYRPGEAGDTSVTGWFFSALKAGQMVGLEVPKSSLDRVYHFLDSVAGPAGGFGYTGPGRLPTCTAIGSLCRLYQGWDLAQPNLADGVDFVLSQPFDVPKPSIYHRYYATQVLYHVGGERWNTWNPKIRDLLIATQDRLPDPKLQGSWTADLDIHGNVGGRVLTTSLSLLTLEVYYRHVPLHFKARRDPNSK
jgi:hypothetical protein